MVNNSQCTLKFRVLDARVRPTKISWPPLPFNEIPVPYCVLRLRDFHFRSLTFKPQGLLNASSRLTIESHHVCHSPEDFERWKNLAPHSEEVSWDLPLEISYCDLMMKSQKTEEENLSNSLVIEVEVFKDGVDYEDGPLDVFEPELLCRFDIPLSGIQERQGDSWWHKKSDDGKFDVEVRIFFAFSFSDHQEKKSCNYYTVDIHECNQICDYESVEEEKFKNREGFDDLGHKIIGSFNLMNYYSFQSLNHQRYKYNKAQWDAILQNDSSLLESAIESISNAEHFKNATYSVIRNNPPLLESVPESHLPIFEQRVESNPNLNCYRMQTVGYTVPLLDSLSSENLNFAGKNQFTAESNDSHLLDLNVETEWDHNARPKSIRKKPLQFCKKIRNLVWNHGIPPVYREQVYRKISEDILSKSENSPYFLGGGKLYYNALVRHFEFLCGGGNNLSTFGKEELCVCSPECSSESTAEYFDARSHTEEEKFFSDGSEEFYMPAGCETPVGLEPRNRNSRKQASESEAFNFNQRNQYCQRNRENGSCNVGDNDHHIASKMAQSVALEIDKDVNRVFKQGRTYVNKPEGSAALRRVLGAYAMRNSTIGYCQGMNFIAGLLLQVTSEETAFWMLASVCEGPLVGYHSRNMLTVRADMSALRVLFEEEFPDLSDMATSAGLPLELIVTPSLVVCFINFLPAPTALRCFEIILLEGAVGIFAIALAFIRLHEEIFAFAIETDSLVHAVNAAQTGMYDAQMLLDQAAREMESKGHRIRKLRRKFYKQCSGREKSDNADINGESNADFSKSAGLLLLLSWAEHRVYATIPPLRFLGGGVKGVANTTIKTIQWLLGWKILLQINVPTIENKTHEKDTFKFESESSEESID